MQNILGAGFGAFIGALVMVGIGLLLTGVFYLIGFVFGLKGDPARAVSHVLFDDKVLPFVLLYFGALGGLIFAKTRSNEDGSKP